MTAEPLTLTDAEKLRILATWFDEFDDWREATNKIAPGIAEYREVQGDLRRIAATLDAARAETPLREAALEVIGAMESNQDGRIIHAVNALARALGYQSRADLCAALLVATPETPDDPA